MTLDEARKTLRTDAGMGELLLAVGTVMKDPNGTLGDLLQGLSHPAMIAEQAAFALYRRTGRPLPHDREQISTDRAEWEAWLRRNEIESTDIEARATSVLEAESAHRAPGGR